MVETKLSKRDIRKLKRYLKKQEKLNPPKSSNINTPTIQYTSSVTPSYGYPRTTGYTPKTTIKRSGGSSQIIVSQVPTQQQYYGELNPANPNLQELRNLSLKQIRDNFAKRQAERIIQFRNKPLRTASQFSADVTYGIPLNIIKGVGTITGGIAEIKQERIQKLKTKIERKESQGQFTGFEKIYKTKLQFEKGIIRATSDTANLISLIPELPKATYLFLANQPISKTKKFLMNLPFNIKITARNLKTQIKYNPAEALSYAFTQYFLFGNKLVGKNKLKPRTTIEKIIIKENRIKNFQDGLFFKWVNKERPVLIKFKTDLNINLNKLKAQLNKIAGQFKKRVKGEEIKGKNTPYYKDIGYFEETPIKKGGGGKSKNIEITFKNKGWDSLSLKEQTKLVGKKLNLVSAQADRLVYLLRRQRLIKKPIQGLKLTNNEIRLLNKLNRGGKLNKYEVGVLDKAFKRTTKGVLAKSFFASSSTKVRVSRLGLSQREAGLIDVFKGNFRLRRNKPQILLFVNQRIQNFPRNLKGIQKKLLSGKSLTNSEKLDLLNFQLKKSGRFKPIGFLTREAEVTLSPNEIIRRIKRLTSVRIQGRSVPIIQAEVVKIESKLTKNLMNRAYKGERLTKAELNKLNKGIQKESGFKSSYSYSGNRKPYLNLKSKLLSFFIHYQPKKPINYFPRGGSYAKGRYTPTPTGGYIPRGRYTPTPTGRYTPTGVPPYKPKFPYKYKPKPPISPRFARTEIPKKSKSSQKVGYIVYGLSGGKWLKLNKKPLLKQDALSRGSYAIDRTTAKTFKIVPVGKTASFGGLIKREKGYYTKTSPKFREYKIQKGRRFIIKMKLIEKRRYGIDTTGEKKGLSLARYLSKLKKSKY